MQPDAALVEGRDGDDGESSAGWEKRPLAELIEHLVGHDHRRLRAELPQLIALAGRVEQRHAGRPGCPLGLHDHLQLMHEAVLDHLMKEERILFPLILAGGGAQAARPVHALEVEHTDHHAALLCTRRLTGQLLAPTHACSTWRELYRRLAAFERELTEHIHLENNVLFYRALLS